MIENRTKERSFEQRNAGSYPIKLDVIHCFTLRNLIGDLMKGMEPRNDGITAVCYE